MNEEINNLRRKIRALEVEIQELNNKIIYIEDLEEELGGLQWDEKERKRNAEKEREENESKLRKLESSLKKLLRDSNDTEKRDFKSSSHSETEQVIDSKGILQEKKVFISYSHKDEEWLESMLIPHLGGVKNKFQYWYDKKIRAGENRKKLIIQAIHTSQAAILILSKNFLASDFIKDIVIPEIREKRLRVFPIHADHCVLNYYEYKDWLLNMNILPSINYALSTMKKDDQNIMIVGLIHEISQFFDNLDKGMSVRGQSLTGGSEFDKVKESILNIEQQLENLMNGKQVERYEFDELKNSISGSVEQLIKTIDQKMGDWLDKERIDPFDFAELAKSLFRIGDRFEAVKDTLKSDIKAVLSSFEDRIKDLEKNESNKTSHTSTLQVIDEPETEPIFQIVVPITCINSNGQITGGTGFLIEEGIIVTCYHIIGDKEDKIFYSDIKADGNKATRIVRAFCDADKNFSVLYVPDLVVSDELIKPYANSVAEFTLKTKTNDFGVVFDMGVNPKWQTGLRLQEQTISLKELNKVDDNKSLVCYSGNISEHEQGESATMHVFPIKPILDHIEAQKKALQNALYNDDLIDIFECSAREIDHPFCITKDRITNKQFYQVFEHPYQDEKPAEVSWYEANQYAIFSGGCLPSEKEWCWAIECEPSSFMVETKEKEWLSDIVSRQGRLTYRLIYKKGYKKGQNIINTKNGHPIRQKFSFRYASDVCE